MQFQEPQESNSYESIANLWRPFFANLELNLRSIDLANVESFIESSTTYQFNFSQRVNYLAFEGASNFFPRLFSEQYVGAVANVVEEYFARRCCFVLLQCAKQLGYSERITFIRQLSARIDHRENKFWEIRFAFESSQLKLGISSSPPFSEFLDKLRGI